MRIVIQKVSNANVNADGEFTAEISQGLLVLVAICANDKQQDIDWLCNKIASLRLFADESGNMNRSINDVNGDVLVISQFTLYASIKKGNRPSFIRSARPEVAKPLYDSFVTCLSNVIDSNVKTGVFGANMKVGLVNDGPVTICIDSKEKE
jgi:D-tyrosyl-tRNA(Tyr) deacylase